MIKESNRSKIELHNVDCLPFSGETKKYCHKMSCERKVEDDLFCDMHREQTQEERKPFDEKWIKEVKYNGHGGYIIDIPSYIVNRLNLSEDDRLQIEITENADDNSLGFVVFKEKK